MPFYILLHSTDLHTIFYYIGQYQSCWKYCNTIPNSAVFVTDAYISVNRKPAICTLFSVDVDFIFVYVCVFRLDKIKLICKVFCLTFLVSNHPSPSLGSRMSFRHSIMFRLKQTRLKGFQMSIVGVGCLVCIFVCSKYLLPDTIRLKEFSKCINIKYVFNI